MSWTESSMFTTTTGKLGFFALPPFHQYQFVPSAKGPRDLVDEDMLGIPECNLVCELDFEACPQQHMKLTGTAANRDGICHQRAIVPTDADGLQLEPMTTREPGSE